MKEAQLVNHEDVQIVSQINHVVKITKDVTIAPLGTIKVKGVIKVPNHYKHFNASPSMIFPMSNDCKDIAVVYHIQILRPGSNKIPIVLQNLSCQAVKVKKGTKIAHVMAGNVVPPTVAPQLDKNICQEGCWKCSKG